MKCGEIEEWGKKENKVKKYKIKMNFSSCFAFFNLTKRIFNKSDVLFKIRHFSMFLLPFCDVRIKYFSFYFETALSLSFEKVTSNQTLLSGCVKITDHPERSARAVISCQTFDWL